ncbi:hypothetical protein ACSBR1_021152 [Camellia fascicularis]
MADFPPNLDDGELWLPSDIFPLEEIPSKITRPYYPSDLAHRFAALAFLDRHRNQTQRFGPVRYDSMGSLPTGYLTIDGGFGVGNGLGFHGLNLWVGSRPVYYPHHIINPVQPQVESFMETRARVLQREQNWLLQNRVLENRQKTGLGMRGGGGFVREYGGTGVFLPRAAVSATTSTADGRRRQSVGNRKETKVIPHGNPMKMDVVGKQEECHYHLPPDMGLPQDWTY